MSTIKVDNLETTSGAGLYPSKVWVLFDGTGTVSVRGSGNVSSVTDNGAGTFTTNFSSTLSSANYGFSHGCSGSGESAQYNSHYKNDDTKTTSAFKLYWGYSTPSATSAADVPYAAVTVTL
jgi:hypothetical protein